MPKSSSDIRHFYIVGVLIAITTALLYWLMSIGMPLPFKASVEADTIDWLIDLHLILIAFLFAIVVVFMLYSIVVFRRKAGDTGDGEHFEGNTLLEVIWTAAPLILVFVFMYIGWDTLNAITTPKGNELVVTAVGRQWSWTFAYANGVVSPELVLPVNQPIRMELETEDVIHAFWVQEFRVKQDVMPGQTNHVLFTATKTSAEYMAEAGMEYKLRCAELCGTTHYDMIAPVKVLPTAEFEQWLAAQAAENSQAVAQTTK
jgi:cytochrome c oxidase subunit II